MSLKLRVVGAVAAAILVALMLVTATTQAQAQPANCVVGMSMEMPPRYTVAADSSAASMGGYPIVVFGPSTWDRCGAFMAAANIPSWAAYAGIALGPSVSIPQPESNCTLGKNCCYVGSSWDREPAYAIAYDSMLASGSQILAEHGYPSLVFGPVSVSACHGWWNDNVAAAGLGDIFPNPEGLVPFPPGAFGGAGVAGGSTAGLRAPPPNGPSGPQGPRAPTIGISVALSPNAWVRQSQYIGPISAAPQGLVLGGAAWTNGQLRNGAYDGNAVRTQETFDLSGGGDVYLAFAADGAGRYMAIWPRVLPGIGGNFLTTHNEWAGSIVIPERSWIFLHVTVSPGGSAQLGISLGGYDDMGGQVIYSVSGQLTQGAVPLELRFSDNYAGEATSLLIGEAWVYAGGQQSAGGSCSVDADCPGSVCLLGVCAPPVR